jgi:hypothetical protein
MKQSIVLSIVYGVKLSLDIFQIEEIVQASIPLYPVQIGVSAEIPPYFGKPAEKTPQFVNDIPIIQSPFSP